MTKTPIFLALIGLTALSACVTPNNLSSDPNANTKQGVAIGAVSGALLGAASGGDDKLEKALVGAVVGGALGGAVGYSLDQQAAELRSQLSSGLTVTNNGEYLVVNMPQDLLFATDSASVRPDLTRDLKAIAASLQKYPTSNITVQGHTDNTGTAAYNLDLSQRRASSVAAILRDSGVASNRMAIVGRGEDQPIASNLTPEGRAQNRRVEIIIRPSN